MDLTARSSLISMKKEYEYRVIRFSQVESEYRSFLANRKLAYKNKRKNEFEPNILSIEELIAKIGFYPENIVIAFFPYMTAEKIERYVDSNLSTHAQSIDYHIVCKKLLEGMKDEYAQKNPASNFYIQSDNGLFNERFFAIKSGLCMEGENGMAIHSDYGSFGFLGMIATDLSVEEYTTPEKKCRGCNLCRLHCPSNAIQDCFVDSSKCLSYLSQKKNLTQEEEYLLQKSCKAFGCDLCQMVCPENKNIKYTEIEDFQINLMYNIKLEEVKEYSNKEFKVVYRDRNFSWRGKAILVRNLVLQKNESNDQNY